MPLFGYGHPPLVPCKCKTEQSPVIDSSHGWTQISCPVCKRKTSDHPDPDGRARTHWNLMNRPDENERTKMPTVRRDKVIEMICFRSDLHPGQVKDESTFAELGMDSMDRIELRFDLEDEYQIDLQEPIGLSMTVKQLLDKTQELNKGE